MTKKSIRDARLLLPERTDDSNKRESFFIQGIIVSILQQYKRKIFIKKKRFYPNYIY